MKNYFSNIKAAFGSDVAIDDKGGFVDEIILMSGFALVAIAVVTWIGGAVMNRGADVAECINGANVYANSKASDTCAKADHNKKKQWSDDGAYKKRFG